MDTENNFHPKDWCENDRCAAFSNPGSYISTSGNPTAVAAPDVIYPQESATPIRQIRLLDFLWDRNLQRGNSLRETMPAAML